MWVFGHLGIGSQLAKPFSRGLPYRWLLLGTLLSDLLDKPLYYIPHFWTGLSGSELGLLSCTRTFGHSGILFFLVIMLAWIKKSNHAWAIALGMSTHLVLDFALDGGVWQASGEPAATWMAIVFPYYGKFSVQPFKSIGEHAHTIARPVLWISEIVGLLILLWNLIQIKKQKRLTESDLN